MDVNGAGALITGGASGLGAATARLLVERGARVALADLDAERAHALADELGDAAVAVPCDVTDPAETEAAVDEAATLLGGLRLAVGCAGVGWAERTVHKRGPHSFDPFQKVIQVNLIGMFNLLRLGAAAIEKSEPGADGERGAVIMTASVAAFDGQIGQVSYSASKGGIVGMTLPAARDLAGRGIRVNTIAPGLFDTPLLAALPDEARKALGAGVPFPQRLGKPAEYAALAVSIAENTMLNGETIRLDGALRMPPK
jgi:NAD(P)-dependent dehydrogenase (short-subunit alcohol dehydrogenase family)